MRNEDRQACAGSRNRIQDKNVLLVPQSTIRIVITVLRSRASGSMSSPAKNTAIVLWAYSKAGTARRLCAQIETCKTPWEVYLYGSVYFCSIRITNEVGWCLQYYLIKCAPGAISLFRRRHSPSSCFTFSAPFGFRLVLRVVVGRTLARHLKRSNICG